MKYGNFVTLEIIKEYAILGGFFWQAMQHMRSSFPDQICVPCSGSIKP